MSRNYHFKSFVVAATALLASSAAWAADGDPWSVSKSSGEVWLTTQGAQQVALGSDNELKPGDTIRTGRTGRVLLTRGAETMLISPNSVIDVPTDARDGMGTTILQRAGSILLDVEHRNVKHFEVETPYLAAVVKGTQFSVTVGAGSTKVQVNRGQVEVADFKSGQIAQIMPGQAATAFAHSKMGLSLSGSGSFAPIEHGRPRASTIERVPVPKGGLQAPHNAAKGGAIHAVHPVGGPIIKSAAPSAAQPGRLAAHAKPNGVHISSSLGEVKLNVHSATHGLAHDGVRPGVRSTSRTDTVWSDAKAGSSSSNGASSSSGGDASSTASGASSTAAAVSAAVGSSSGGANINSGVTTSTDNSNGKGPGGNGPPGKGPGGNGPGGKGPGGNGPGGKGPNGNGPPGNSGNGPGNGHGPPAGHGKH
jgi:hypothetical protein